MPYKNKELERTTSRERLKRWRERKRNGETAETPLVLNNSSVETPVLTVEERKLRLSLLAEGYPRYPNPIAAISELNKMEHIYELGGNIRDVNVVFIIGKGYQNVPQLKEGDGTSNQTQS